jgi:phage terminase small subunit
MATLKNARHEAFARCLAEGKTADEAYQAAGFSPNRGNATRLKANESIRKRVEQIVNRVSEKAQWTAADRLLALKSIFDAAAVDDRRTAIAAIAEANKMQGSYPPSQHRVAGPNGGPIQTVDLTKLSDDDLARLEDIFGPLAGPGDDDAPDQVGEGEASAGG